MEKSQIRWQCRRGMKELDVLFEGFLAVGFDALSVEEKAHFEELLTFEDDLIYDWVLGRCEPEPHLRGLLSKIQNTMFPQNGK